MVEREDGRLCAHACITLRLAVFGAISVGASNKNGFALSDGK